MPDNPGTTIGKWTGGVNSLVPPDAIGLTQYAWGINIVNRGGIVQTRPGWDWLSSIAGSKAQGGIIFTPTNSRPLMLVAVDGLIYMAKYPFEAFVQVEGLKFRADAPIINFCACLKSVDVKADESETLLNPPVPLVIIQDGSTNPGKFDGFVATHLNPDLHQTPIGLWMVFAASCLWVFSESRAYVSDLASPDTFFSTTYIAERSAFELPDVVTGCIETSDEKQLLVFTDSTTTAFQCNIRDRTQWGTTPNFQTIVLPTIGCVAGRSCVNQYGLTWWLSRQGFISLDAALQTRQTSKMVTVDGMMSRSKRLLSSDLSAACATYLENYLLLSVPSGGRYNEETWVGDQAPFGEVNSGGMAWVGVWTGARPVTWMRTKLGGRQRIYFLAFDATAKNGSQIHVWEAFQSDRRDNDSAIACQFETGMFLGTDLQRFRYAEIDLIEVLGDVQLTIFVGGLRGEWIQVKSTTLQAEIGSIGSAVQTRLTANSVLQAFKPQTRFIKTEDFSPTNKNPGVESPDTPGKDKGFQLLLEWKGRMGVKSIKLVADPDTSANRGECKPGEVGSHNIVTEAGVTIRV